MRLTKIVPATGASSGIGQAIPDAVARAARVSIEQPVNVGVDDIVGRPMRSPK